jgi:hypothetical protein
VHVTGKQTSVITTRFLPPRVFGALLAGHFGISVVAPSSFIEIGVLKLAFLHFFSDVRS